jgi:cystathionine beta-lyase/cystathionine gamma-synthase
VVHKAVARREALARVSSGKPFSVAFPTKKQASFVMNDFALRYHPELNLFSLDDNASKLLGALHPGRRSAFSPETKTTLTLVEIDELAVACLDDPADTERLRLLRRVWGAGFDVHALSDQEVKTTGEDDAWLEHRLIELEGDRAEGAHLFQSGMAAISCLALLAVQEERRFILVGPAYVDTGVIASRWSEELADFECDWLPANPTTDELEGALQKGPSLLLIELPTNPNLRLPDVPRIVELARRFDTVLAVDATIATPFNFKGLDRGFDVVMHSTSKFLGGLYDHLGGALIASNDELHQALDTARDALDLGMCANQRAILSGNMRGFEARMSTINQNAEQVVERLRACEKIDEVWYPGSANQREEALAKALLSPGRSGLLSFSLKDKGREPLRAFYDAIREPIKKGPGLGGETSLICPYVMLAHYHDTEAFLKKQELDIHSLRLSVGTEPVEEIVEALGLEA